MQKGERQWSKILSRAYTEMTVCGEEVDVVEDELEEKNEDEVNDEDKYEEVHHGDRDDD